MLFVKSTKLCEMMHNKAIHHLLWLQLWSLILPSSPLWRKELEMLNQLQVLTLFTWRLE